MQRAYRRSPGATGLVEKCQRYFMERANQDSKSERGWDEVRAQKYRAWEPHLALTVLASWFVAQTHFAWAQHYPPLTRRC